MCLYKKKSNGIFPLLGIFFSKFIFVWKFKKLNKKIFLIFWLFIYVLNRNLGQILNLSYPCQVPKGPSAQRPKCPKAQVLKGPSAQIPKTPSAQSPINQKPTSSKAQNPPKDINKKTRAKSSSSSSSAFKKSRGRYAYSGLIIFNFISM